MRWGVCRGQSVWNAGIVVSVGVGRHMGFSLVQGGHSGASVCLFGDFLGLFSLILCC
jgi:hypothetical protein